jgi:hypothetical protein
MRIINFNLVPISAMAALLASTALATPIVPTPGGMIGAVALTGSGPGQSNPTLGEIDFSLNNMLNVPGYSVTGKEVATASGLSFSFSAICPQANCVAFFYDFSAAYSLSGPVVATDAATGTFLGSNQVPVSSLDAFSLFAGVDGNFLLAPFIISNPSGLNFSLSGSDGPKGPFTNSGPTLTLDLQGAARVVGGSDSGVFTGQVTFTQVPEPATGVLMLLAAAIAFPVRRAFRLSLLTGTSVSQSRACCSFGVTYDITL